MLEDFGIKKAKDNIKVLEENYKVTKSEQYLEQIEEERKNIRKLQAKHMERLD